jgi:hypothetical protein
MPIMGADQHRLGQEVRHQVDKYMHYRYADSFIRTLHARVAVNAVFDKNTFATTINIECIGGENAKRTFRASVRIDDNQMLAENHDHDWMMYHIQGVIPLVDTGMFSVWFSSVLNSTVHRRGYHSRVLPEIDQVGYVPAKGGDEWGVSRDSLVVVKMNNGTSWREIMRIIEEDPEAFLATLLMTVP